MPNTILHSIHSCSLHSGSNHVYTNKNTELYSYLYSNTFVEPDTPIQVYCTVIQYFFLFQQNFVLISNKSLGKVWKFFVVLGSVKFDKICNVFLQTFTKFWISQNWKKVYIYFWGKFWHLWPQIVFGIFFDFQVHFGLNLVVYLVGTSVASFLTSQNWKKNPFLPLTYKGSSPKQKHQQKEQKQKKQKTQKKVREKEGWGGRGGCRVLTRVGRFFEFFKEPPVPIL